MLELCDPATACEAVHVHRFDVVVHFAGRKAVGESVQHPMLYYTHNFVGSVNLLEAMRKHNCKNVSGDVEPVTISVLFFKLLCHPAGLPM